MRFNVYEQCIIDQVLHTYDDDTVECLTGLNQQENTIWSKVVAKHKSDFTQNNGQTNILLNLRDLITEDGDKVVNFYKAMGL